MTPETNIKVDAQRCFLGQKLDDIDYEPKWGRTIIMPSIHSRKKKITIISPLLSRKNVYRTLKK